MSPRRESVLTAAALLMEGMTPLYGAAYIILARDTDRTHLGSVTSTNSFLRGLFVGASVLISGTLIQSNGNNYHIAYVFGAFVSSAGFILIMIYGYLMQRGQNPPHQRSIVALEPVPTSLPTILETFE